MHERSVFSVSVLYFILYVIASVFCAVAVIPFLPDEVWVSTSLDSFLKSLAVAFFPSLILALMVYFSKYHSLGCYVSLTVLVFLASCYAYALLRKKTDDDIVLAFLNSFVLPFSLMGILLPLASVFMRNRKKDGK